MPEITELVNSGGLFRGPFIVLRELFNTGFYGHSRGDC